MTHEKISLLRERMRGKDFAGFLQRSPDTATPNDLRAYQLYMTDTEVTPPTYNALIMALRFLFGTTCGREEMKRYMQFRTQPRKLPTVLSVEEVWNLKVSNIVPAARLRHRASGASSTSCQRRVFDTTATGC